MSRHAFFLTVDCGYLPLARGLGQRLAGQWDCDVHVFLEDPRADEANGGSRGRVCVHVNKVAGLRPEGLPVTRNWPAIVYDRIFAPRFLTGYDRLTYLDADIFPLTAAPEALAVPLRHGLGAVQDTASVGFSPHGAGLTRDAWRASIGLRSERYFNSGMLMIDPVLWNQIDFAGALDRFVAAHGQAVRMPDQDFLNWQFQDRWTEFSPRFNFQKGLFNYGYEAWFPPAFLHFSSFQKPWLGPDCADSVQGQFHEPFLEMVRRAGCDADLLTRRIRASWPRRLRKAVRKALSSAGLPVGKERRLRAEWHKRAHPLYDGFVEDLRTGRYADMPLTGFQATEMPRPTLTFDGQYLRRRLTLEAESLT
ncbi:MAG TPA: hypothetical protein EYO87_06165 [Paracoccus sp.]|nr:hypothetical protein [Paracoccus sp. (in: a-proteobacteria)]